MAESSVRYTQLKFITARIPANGADTSFAGSACGCLVRSIVPLGRFTMAECQVRAEFPGERTHRVVLRTRCYAKGLVPLLGPRLLDQQAEQARADTSSSHAGLNAERDFG